MEAASGVSAAVHDVRERRIVTAIVRGFATITFWSPFGTALNTLLQILTDLHWADADP
jgi:phosphotransferase system  glucose/maltose/N-acetylglucosamine-specific IIC component